MPPSTKTHNPFERPTEPKNSWEVLRWLIFDYQLVKEYEKTLSKKEQLIVFLKAYACATLVIIGVWLFWTALVAYFNLPNVFPHQYKEGFYPDWEERIGFTQSWQYYLLETWNEIFLILVIGLITKLVVDLVGLEIGLAGSLGAILSIVLAVVLTVGLAVDVAFFLVIGLVVGLLLGLLGNLDVRFEFILIAGLVVGIMIGFTVILIGVLEKILIGEEGVIVILDKILIGEGGVIGGLLYVIIYLMMFFRLLPFYPYYQVTSFFHSQLDKNPYLRDATISLSLWGLQKKLTQQAQEKPNLAQQLINFLLQYRPLQRNLAMHLTHAAHSGKLQQNPLQARTIVLPNIAEDLLKFEPSEKWKNQLKRTKRKLQNALEHNNLSLQNQCFEKFIKRLADWKQINLLESPLWNHYYFPFFDLWEKEAQLKLEEIKTKLQIEEPITANIYREGEALQPEDEMDEQLFLGRQDIKDELATKILTARTIPLFLVQGQRRVGKTSLLKFLPRILDPSVFKVVQQDLQAVGHEPIRWMMDLRQKINVCLGIMEENDWQPEGTWIEVWLELKQYMEGLALGEHIKLILAFDEYESLHRAFSEDVKQAEQLLGAMRSFSQHQNRIVFLFIGAAFLSDLKEPNWSRFFVQTETLRVHFLNEADSLQLIIQPIPDFNIRYHPSIPSRIYELTQGHPALLQSICRQLVALANQNNNPHLQPEHLEQVLQEKILDFEYKPIAIFWEEEFCHPDYHPLAQETILEVIQQQPISHPKELKRMLRHRYVLKVEGEGYAYRMAVPLFEMWVRRHGLEE